MLTLNYLHCYFVEEENYDDVYLKYNGKKIWPVNKRMKHIMMDTTTELHVDIKNVEPNQKIIIELWDHDWLSANDHLGSFELLIEEIGGPFTTDMKRNKSETDKAKYTLEWEVN